MLIRKAALLSAFIFYAPPALAEMAMTATPKAISNFEVADRAIEVLAVTRRARADTRFGEHYRRECEAMGKVLPGYRQPPLLSVDLRVHF